MGATKIINVLKDDGFNEILDLFKNASAEEVIFVLPKKSKFLSSENHFALLAQSAKEQNKMISLLTSNTNIRDLASQYGFNLLQSKTKSKAKKKPVATATASHMGPPRDGAIHDDNMDAYDEDVIIPSDETIGIEHGEDNTDEEDFMHEEDELPEEKSDETLSSEEDTQEPNDQDLEELEEGDLASADLNTLRPYRVAPVAKIDRTPDAIVQPHGQKNIKVSGHDRRSIPLHVKKQPAREDDIASVWQQNAQDDALWNQLQQPGRKKSFSLFSFFRRREKSPAHQRPVGSLRRNQKSHRFLYVGSLSILVLGSFLAYLFLGKAAIAITPASQPLDLETKVQVSDTIAHIDSVFSKLPGQLISVNRSISRTFAASGQKEVIQKARGTITVYNAYSSAPQILIATTRFQSPEGLIFRTLKTITVPGTSVANGAVVPGKINVEVIADEAGSSYNIGAGDFKIPAFKEHNDTDRYAKIYGKSTQAMSGGVSGLSKVVTEADYTAAKSAVRSQLIDEINSALKTQAADLVVPGSSSIQFGDYQTTANIDQAAEQFTVTLSGTLKTVGFKKDDLFQLLSDIVKTEHSMMLVPDKVSLSYPQASFNADQNVLNLTVKATGTMYAPIDKDAIIQNLMGKSESAIRDYLKTAQGVVSAKVVLSPFWVTKVPKNQDKINFQILY